MTDILKRIDEALLNTDSLVLDGDEMAMDHLGLSARTLLPEAIEEIKRLEAKANQMVADKINLRLELLSVQAKLAMAVEAAYREGFQDGDWGSTEEDESWIDSNARAALAEIKG